MFCTNCGQAIPGDSKFCTNCGAIVGNDVSVGVISGQVTPSVTPDGNQTLKEHEAYQLQTHVPVEQNTQPAGQPMPAAQQPVQPAWQPIPVAQQPMQTAGQPTPAAQQPVQTAGQPMPAAQRPVQPAGFTNANPSKQGSGYVAYENNSASKTQQSQFADNIKSRSRDAWSGLKIFAKNPVGGLSESYALFDDRRAIQVGISFIVAYTILMLLSWRNISPEIIKQLFLPMFLIDLAPFVAIAAAMAVLRAITRGKGKFSGDVYTAGAASLPWGVALFAATFLGIGNGEIILILLLFAITYSILILYAGCSRVAGMSETVAAPAIPIIILISAWLTKVISVAVLNDKASTLGRMIGRGVLPF